MSKLLQQAISLTARFSITKPIPKSDVRLITQRLSCLQLSSQSLHTTAPSKEKLSAREQQRNAYELEKKFGIRSRCVWTKEEDELLLKLYKENGPRYSLISKHFVNRPHAHCANRINLLTNRDEKGPWSKQELATLKEICQNLPPDSELIDWKKVDKALPKRPLAVIKAKYRHACDPTFKKGRWSEEESDQLRRLVAQFGPDNMEQISTIMGTRSRRQCNERWRWQMAVMKKGRYTKEEDEAIMKAVEKYGENFAVIAKVINSQRTPRHISQHYRNKLAPNVDRSPWSRQEELKVYNAFKESDGNLIEAKKQIQSTRSFRDLWNHIKKMEKLAERGAINKKESGAKQVMKGEQEQSLN